MYKVLCDNCGHYNYSASRISNWVCTYCGKKMTENTVLAERIEKKKEKLA